MNLNPTGITRWASTTAMSLPSQQANAPRQNSDFQKPFNFTKQGECVFDNNTGLMWSPAGPSMLWTDCAAYVTQSSFSGFSDWRLPTIKELTSIVDFSRINPALNPVFTGTGIYWSGTVDVSYPDAQFVYALDFGTGGTVRDQPAHPHAVRLVRGAPLPESKFIVNGATVTDSTNGLMWKLDYEMLVPGHPGDWQDRVDTFDWQTCLQRSVTDTTGGHTDWRLPNIKELQSLVPYTHVNPAIDSAFPPTPFQSIFWSSTPTMDFQGNQNLSWLVAFDAGGTIPMPRNFAQYARFVRDVEVTPMGYVTDPAIVKAAYVKLGLIADPAGVEWWAINPLGMKEFWRGVRDELVAVCNAELAKL